ncbi:DUF6544 family protein [Salinivirga cyanobacteriivorans]|nr:DUF6544 family protein [Salinivirga cyanobacteriivorans]
MDNQIVNDLPEPVVKYFSYVLPNKEKRISEVYLKHSGFFKTSLKSKWIKIKGEQHFLTKQPEFKWIGRTLMFKAVDQFINGKGSLKVRLFSLFPIVNEQGKHVDEAELLRWLGESVWFPTNLLPSENLKWLAIDSSSAKLTYSYKGLEVYYIVRFNENGEIIQLETERYMEKGRLEKWIGKVAEYKEFNGIKIPTHIEAIWKLNSGDFKYADFYVDTIEYEY